MKLLGYFLLCLFITRVQLKPQITKLFPVEGLAAYQKQLTNATKSWESFLGKLRATYNIVFRQPDNNTSNIEKILAKNSDLQSLKLIWADSIKADNYTANLKYPNNSLLDQVKTLSVLKEQISKNSSSLEKDSSSLEIKSTIKADENNVNLTSSNKTLPEDDWFNDIQPLGELELQDEELDKKNVVEIVTPATTLQLSTTVARHFLEWLGSLFGLTYSIYTKLSGTACDNQKATQ